MAWLERFLAGFSNFPGQFPTVAPARDLKKLRCLCAQSLQPMASSFARVASPCVNSPLMYMGRIFVGFPSLFRVEITPGLEYDN